VTASMCLCWGASRGGRPESSNYASATALNGPSWSFNPSRYQNDESSIRKQRQWLKLQSSPPSGLCRPWSPKTSIKCHTLLSWAFCRFVEDQKIASVTQQVPDRQPFQSKCFQGRQRRPVMAWQKAFDREYLLLKLREFHRTHHSIT